MVMISQVNNSWCEVWSSNQFQNKNLTHATSYCLQQSYTDYKESGVQIVAGWFFWGGTFYLFSCQNTFYLLLVTLNYNFLISIS